MPLTAECIAGQKGLSADASGSEAMRMTGDRRQQLNRALKAASEPSEAVSEFGASDFSQKYFREPKSWCNISFSSKWLRADEFPPPPLIVVRVI